MSPLAARRCWPAILLALLVATTSACTISLRTFPGAVCPAARVSGVLARDANSGLGLRDASGNVHPTSWPPGYTARQEITGIVLVDHRGGTVAREGDWIEGAGAWSQDNVIICDPVRGTDPQRR
ncbi:MAG: hypothetical protein FIA92_06785 [Chloroflexi bacterium]|nr:hypothetical protein [Chloroflexota bacterium]